MTKVRTTQNTENAVRVVEFPKVRRLEDHFILSSPIPSGEEFVQFGFLIDDAATELFSIPASQLIHPLHGYLGPDGPNDISREGLKEFILNKEDLELKRDLTLDDYFILLDSYDEYEDIFETIDLSDDEIVTYFLKFGIDFRDERGQPLRCTKVLCRVAEAVVKEIAGKMPDADELKLRHLEGTLSTEAKKFLSTKHRR